MGRRRAVTAGEPLIWEDDASLLVANVIEGVLKLTTSTADGREQIVGVAYPSDFIGRPFGQTSAASVVALTDARVCVFSRNDFDRYAREHPELEHKLLERTLAELDRTRLVLEDLFEGTFAVRRPRLAYTLEIREEPLKVLHVQQVNLLRDWRARIQAGQTESAEAMMPDLLISVNALASGLRTTG
jgi:CRP-like cAMP-binding protein